MTPANTQPAGTSEPFSVNSDEKKVCPVCGFDHEEIRAQARQSLFFTARAICNFQNMTTGFHGKMAEWAEQNIRGNQRKMLVLASRVFFKTSLMTIAMSIWMIINNPRVRILILQQSDEKVTEVMSAIRGIITGSTFVHYFPELVPEPHARFSNRAIEVPRSSNDPEATITARGIRSAVTGGHFDVHILDDVIGHEQADSKLLMDAVVSWFKASNPLFVHYVSGIRIVIGTRWAMNDLYQHVLDTGTHAVWNVGCRWDERAEQMGLQQTESRSLFPERYPDGVLDQMEAETDPIVWSFQYLNVPVVPGLLRFDRSMFRYYKWLEPNRRFICAGATYDVRDAIVTIKVDPSLGETAQSDEFALTVCAWWPRYADAAVLECYHDRITPIQQADKIISTYRKWRDAGCKPIVGVEKAAYQAALIHFTTDRQRQSQTYFYIEPVTHGGVKKSRRIEGLQPYYANHQVMHHSGLDALESQLLGFQPREDGSTGLPYDDIIDSLAYHVPHWKGVNYDQRQSPNSGEALKDWIEDWSEKPQGKEKPLYDLTC